MALKNVMEAFEVCREKGYLTNTSIISLSWWSIISQKMIDELFGKDFPNSSQSRESLFNQEKLPYIRSRFMI